MSIVEKMARAMFENTPTYKDSTRERRWEWADFPCDDIDPRRYLLGQARAALTATGLTEAQLEGLANGTMVVVRAPADKAQRDAENRAWDDARAAMLDAHERRNKLAAKEG